MGNSHTIHQIIGDQNRCTSIFAALHYKTIYNCQILHSVMRYIGKQINVCLCRNDFHRKFLFHVLIILKSTYINRRGSVKTISNDHCCTGKHSGIIIRVLIACKSILNIEINSHIAAFRNNRHSLIILIGLLHIIEDDSYIIIASLIELFFDILSKLLLECFVIHRFPLLLTRNRKIHNLVFIRDIVTVSIVIFCERFLCISHISIICKLSHFVNGHIPAVSLIINVIRQIVRNFHHTEFFDIVTSQISIVFYSRIYFILIQVINKIDHIFNAACIITDLHCRL